MHLFAILYLFLVSSFPVTNAFAPSQPKARVVSSPASVLTKLWESSTIDTFSCVDRAIEQSPIEQPKESGKKRVSIRSAAFATTILGTAVLLQKKLAIAAKILVFAKSVSLFKAIRMSLVGSVMALFVWNTYSSRIRASLKEGIFGAMELLSETRDNYGNITNIPIIAERFSEGTIDDLEKGRFQRLASSNPTNKFTNGDGSTIRIQGDVAIQYKGQEWMLYGRKKPTTLSLRELVAEITPTYYIEENLFKRMNWVKKMNDCVPPTGGVEVKGSYRFCYRDYVNHEELMGMMWKRGGIENFLFKIGMSGRIDINRETKKCKLTESSTLFCFIPISIVWDGTLEGSTINWYTSSLTLGWKRFQKFFDKPAAAEKLRKDPWRISTPREDYSGDIACFERDGKGHLAYAKEECFSNKKTL